MQRVRLRYTKRNRLRFTSHRDFQRAFERALRRAKVRIAYSAGFTPHPKVSYAGAAPTGVGSEAEYLEIALTQAQDPEGLRRALDSSLPAGLDIVEAVEARTTGFPERLQASVWRIRLPGVGRDEAGQAVAKFLAEDHVEVERRTKNGVRSFDTRAAVVALDTVDEQVAPVVYPVADGAAEPGSHRPAGGACAILRLVVRHLVPAVRPDDVLSGLRAVAGLAPPIPAEVIRLAQGPLDRETGTVADPLAPDRDAATAVLHETAGQPAANMPAGPI